MKRARNLPPRPRRRRPGAGAAPTGPAPTGQSLSRPRQVHLLPPAAERRGRRRRRPGSGEDRRRFQLAGLLPVPRRIAEGRREIHAPGVACHRLPERLPRDQLRLPGAARRGRSVPQVVARPAPVASVARRPRRPDHADVQFTVRLGASEITAQPPGDHPRRGVLRVAAEMVLAREPCWTRPVRSTRSRRAHRFSSQPDLAELVEENPVHPVGTRRPSGQRASSVIRRTPDERR